MNLNYHNELELLPYENLPDFERYRFLDGRVQPSQNPVVQKFFRELANKLLSRLHVPNINRQRTLKFFALMSILTNLFMAADQDQVVIYSRDKNVYSSIHRKYGYDWYSYRMYIPLIDALREEDYIGNKSGYYNNILGIGDRSRMWCSPKLKDEFSELHDHLAQQADIKVVRYSKDGPLYILEDHSPERIVPANTPLILKDTCKNWIDYDITRGVKSKLSMLNEYNEFMSGTEVLLPVNEGHFVSGFSTNVDRSGLQREKILQSNNNTEIQIDIINNMVTHTVSYNSNYYKELDCSVRRIFNRESFTNGGRFYCHEYQQLNSNERAKLLLNGESVVELDFSALHPTMLYHLHGIELRHDPYDFFDDQLLRKAVKLLMTISMNSKSPQHSIYVFNDKLTRQYLNPEKQIKVDQMREQMLNYGLTAEKLYSKILESHPKLEAYMSSDYGVRLQYLDSQIAASILGYFTKQGVPILCVHDSFIVPASKENELEAVMHESYKKVLNGHACPIDKK